MGLGLVGLALLAGPSLAAAVRGDTGAVDVGAVGLLLVGASSWAVGSVLGRDMPRPDNAFMGSAIQMGVVATTMLASPLGSRCALYATSPLPTTSSISPPVTAPRQCSRFGNGTPLSRNVVNSTIPARAWRAAIMGHGGIVSTPILIARYVLPQMM